MGNPDLILLHPPSVYDFRRIPQLYGPISDVVPSVQIFDMYPLGFLTISEYLTRHDLSTRIVNLALKMLSAKKFDPESLIRSLHPVAFGIDFHWLCHAQGSLEIARIVKKWHPRIPVIFGGLSASYYHRQLIQYPQVDYVLRGDSVEEPLRQLVKALKYHGSLSGIPNLTWKDREGQINVNQLSWVPPDLDMIRFDYLTVARSALKYRDLSGHLPFNKWMDYPILAVLPWRGCLNNCVTCGGSRSAYQRICGREHPAYRSPDRLAQDIKDISSYSVAPIMILGDIFAAPDDYGNTFLKAMEKCKIRNHLAFELHLPPVKEIQERLAHTIPNFNLQISPESHDPGIRKRFGRPYDNDVLEKAIDNALASGCQRLDLFFMIGLSHQTYTSVMDTVRYCEHLIDRFGGNGRMHPFFSPLAPFLDPGSLAFEDPQRFGYRLLHRSLEEHRTALLNPSWKHMLNYETKWMSKDTIVEATYEACLRINKLKKKCGLVESKASERIEEKIRRERSLLQKIDQSVNTGFWKEQVELYEDRLNGASACDKKELQWPKGLKLMIPRLVWKLLRNSVRVP